MKRLIPPVLLIVGTALEIDDSRTHGIVPVFSAANWHDAHKEYSGQRRGPIIWYYYAFDEEAETYFQVEMGRAYEALS